MWLIFQCIPYAVLLQELDIKNVRDLEDLIIEAIYAGEDDLL
jgi:COP9 signalosome complex subunit 7